MERTETAAFVLHTESTGEQGLGLDLISPTLGRIKVWSPHGRSRRSQVKAMAQLFSPLLITFKLEGGQRILCGCATAGMPFTFNPPFLFTALYLNELTALLFREEGAGPLFFAAYLRALSALQALQNNTSLPQTLINDQLECILRNFELDVIACSGFNFDWLHEAFTGEPIEVKERYVLEPENGFRLFIPGENPELKLLLTGEQILAVANRDFAPDSLKVAKKICRLFITHLLQGQSLRSRQLYIDYLKSYNQESYN